MEKHKFHKPYTNRLTCYPIAKAVLSSNFEALLKPKNNGFHTSQTTTSRHLLVSGKQTMAFTSYSNYSNLKVDLHSIRFSSVFASP